MEYLMNKQRLVETDANHGQTPATGTAGSSTPGKAYTPPQIEDYGRVADLTASLSTKTPGDGYGGSFAV